MKSEVYMYGQILGTHSFLLRDGFLQPDEYSEIKEKYFLPGGETGTAATVLASLGVNVKMDGTIIGTEVAKMLRPFYEAKTVDLSSLTFDENYEGLMDYVVIHGLARSPMGFFQTIYSNHEKRWSNPKEADIKGCKVAAVDPYFLEESLEAAKLCVSNNKPFVTIDSAHDTYFHQHAAINIVSKECLETDYKGEDPEDVFRKLQETSSGLTIITQGTKDMLYGRKGEPMKRKAPFKVEVKSTLGAGDTYKAGCIYALLNGFSDDETVRFASACSAMAVSVFPLPLNPPTLENVNKILGK